MVTKCLSLAGGGKGSLEGAGASPRFTDVPGLLYVFTATSMGTWFFQNCAKKGSARVSLEAGPV